MIDKIMNTFLGANSNNKSHAQCGCGTIKKELGRVKLYCDGLFGLHEVSESTCKNCGSFQRRF